jgi:hypothetical protein
MMVSPARRRIWLNTLLPPLTLFATAFEDYQSAI